MIKNQKKKGFILAIIAALFWGYMGVPTRNLNNLNFDSFSVCFFRTSISAIFYFIYCLIKDPSSLKVNKKKISFFAFYGVVCFGITFVSYNISVSYISIALATMFMFTSQVWVVILSYFIFKEKFTIQKVMAIILNLCGCFMMCKAYDLSNTSMNYTGVIFGLLSGFTFALQIIFAKINSDKGNQNILLAYAFIFASLFLLPFANIKNTLEIFTSCNNIFPIFKGIFIISVLNTIIANGAYIKSVQYISAGLASIIASSEIVIASITAYFVFHETLDMVQIIGMVLILASIILLDIKIRKLSIDLPSQPKTS